MSHPLPDDPGRREQAKLNIASLQAVNHLRTTGTLPALCTLFDGEKFRRRHPELEEKIGDSPVLVVPEQLDEAEIADMETFLSTLVVPGEPDGVILSHTVTIRDPNTGVDQQAVLHTGVWRGGLKLILLETIDEEGKPMIKDGSKVEPVIAEALHAAIGH
ncbi:hypothetical protein ACFSSC_10735 [Corynebacterium mendelii]|uniref:Uncharacterized protein n=1 Tax=Corynebacterium mendelii TaxID=2765362 RepID=A0A939IXU9_9CORY|nr:hypothetical protein [Corynebacterium mendelii]MBN9644438.1 hypothetical protein [Corynebacterium mendelii]